jgi:outer membrane cobalamin receptor
MTMGNKRTIERGTDSSPSKNIHPKRLNDQTTPNKTNCKPIDEEMNDSGQYGDDSCCAARNSCINTLRAATSKYKCKSCNYYAHENCRKEIIDSDNKKQYYCLWCHELYALETQEKIVEEDEEKKHITHQIHIHRKITEDNNASKIGTFGTVEEEMEEKIKMGDLKWCGAREKCTNSSCTNNERIRMLLLSTCNT